MRILLPFLALLLAACTTAVDGTPEGTPSSPNARRKVLDGRAVEQGVRKILKERYQEDVSTVRCPDRQAVQVGNQFTCQVTVQGEQRVVTITVKSESGTYEVSQSS